MRVADLREFDGSGALITVAGDVTVHEAVRTMAASSIGAVLILDDQDKVRGIFTERDLMTKVVGKELDPKTTRVLDVMTTGVKTVRVDDAAVDCLELMAAGRFRHLPVVDADDHPIGMLSQRDFVATTLPKALALTTQTARATVSKRYQPFAIGASVLAYTLVIVLAVRLFT
ncbi:MAG: CBS domain-containing protein [Geminicoccaceae bacterium]|nr:MAG: CBS domain-containing protein [Geminicoccaceae bacterium]